MQTIYIYDHNISNLLTLLLTIAVLVVFIVGGIFFSPLLKQSIQLITASTRENTQEEFPNIEKSATICIVTITAIIYIILICGSVFGCRLIHTALFRWIDTDISSCESVSGKISNFNYNTIKYREVMGYECDFTIENKVFSDINIDQKHIIQHLAEDHEFIVYYKEYTEGIYVVRIDMIVEQG